MGRRAARKARRSEKTKTLTLEDDERERQEAGQEEEEEGEGSEDSNGSGGGGVFFACYLLCSLSPRHKGRTYIGWGFKILGFLIKDRDAGVERKLDRDYLFLRLILIWGLFDCLLGLR